MFKKLIVSKTLRRRVSWLIAAVLIFPFILFFHATSRAPIRGDGATAGIIFGKQIPWQTFQEQRLWLRHHLQDQFGELPDTLAPLVTQYTWDRLLLLEEAHRRHLRVTDQDLAAAIQHASVFQDHGWFVPERYRRALEAMGTTPQLFERLLRSDLLIEKLVHAINASVTVSDEDIRAAYATEHERIRATLWLFEPKTWMRDAAAGVTEAAVHTFYETRPEELRIPEQLVVDYLGATREELAAHVQPSEEALTAFYQDHPSQFTKNDGTTKPFPEVRDTVRQQVIEEQVRKQLKSLALDLHEDLEDKLTFDAIAARQKLTPHTVGPLAIDHMRMLGTPDPALLEALVKLPMGKVSEVVETPTGTYLGRVTQRLASRIPAFDEVRATITARLTSQRAKDAAHAAAQHLRERLTQQFARGLRFEEAALTLGPLPAFSAQFTRTQFIDRIGSVPAVNAMAFQLPLGTLSDVMDTPAGAVLLRPEERLIADPPKSNEATTELRDKLLAQKQAEQLDRVVRDLRVRAKLESFVDTPPQDQDVP